MKAVMVMFDSLNRHMLPPYNPDTWVHAPNFRRLAARTATFDRSYVCSMPCMPARRDMHTGRPNFLHTSWGPLEPFDDSVPAMLSAEGVYTHLDSDHYHYWEDGGSTYHNRYNSWQFFRGQEGDPFIGQIADPEIPENINGKGRRSDWVNRQYLRSDEQMPQSQTFKAGVDFIDRNHDEDRWFLQIECFDPHEPFVSDRRWRERYTMPSPDDPVFDWPPYGPVEQTEQQVATAQRNYAALMSRCDASLGDVLDAFDRHNLWDDTMLIVCTDHGYMLGEHQCWAKNWMPLYEEVSHTPFFVWDPRHPKAAGQRREALVQPAIDVGPTLLRFFGLEPTADMLGCDLGPVMADDQAVRDAAIFGYHGNRVNVTDGRYVYMRARLPEKPSYRYTLMTNPMRGFVNMKDAELTRPFGFTKEMPLLKVAGGGGSAANDHEGHTGHLLFDLQADPGQKTCLDDREIESRMIDHMTRLMAACEAPSEVYEALDVAAPNG